MKLFGDGVRLSANDLSNHLGCRHLTELNLLKAAKKIEPPSWQDPRLEALQAKGLLHEQAYVQHLESRGLQLTRLAMPRETSTEEACAATIEAMRSGVDVIVQATLHNGRWLGRADILQRVDKPSDLGRFSYEVYDTKLSTETRAGTILQLCLYSDLVREIQGVLPGQFYVVGTGVRFEPEPYRLNEFLAYYRYLKKRLEDTAAEHYAHHNSKGNGAPRNDRLRFVTYPEPTPQCDICNWWRCCDKRWHDDDHLSLVAGMTKLHQTQVKDAGYHTMEALSRAPEEAFVSPARGSALTYAGLQHQARVQVQGRREKRPVHELLELEGEKGLSRLPEPSPGDVFFDFEGARFAGEGGFEYLFGYVLIDGPKLEYKTLWSTTEAEEKHAFETFVDEMMARWQAHPDFHIYHFAHYEPTALKRLMGRYGTREDEVDRLLRGKRFVDLHAAVRQGLRASVESYSLKKLEPFYGFHREQQLEDASRALHEMELSLELSRFADLPDETRQVIERYNHEDCLSTLHLRDWLESLRTEALAAGGEIPRPMHDPEGEAEERLSAHLQHVADLKERLTADVPVAREERDDEQHARWLLAELLDWHRREKKVFWWEYFRLRDLSYDELLEERHAVIGLHYVGDASEHDRKTIHRYTYPPQECAFKPSTRLVDLAEKTIGKIAAIRPVAREIDVEKDKNALSHHPDAVLSKDVIRDSPLDTRLVAMAEHVLEHGLDAAGPYQTAVRLLFAERPRFGALAESRPQLKRDGESNLDAAQRLVGELQNSVFPIQGPPGTGKTYTGALMIASMLQAGKRVGVTASGHKVACNLMKEVVGVCEERGIEARLAHAGRQTAAEAAGVTHAGDNSSAAKKFAKDQFDVLSGTAWLWAREDMRQSVDVLFVDEAGQMSFANAIAIAWAAKNLVLIGDPRQLDQPVQGSHPPGTAVSVLEHLLGEHKTMPKDRGLFLFETWRLHPELCGYTSEIFYEGRLESKPGLEYQAILGCEGLPEAGLHFHPVDHYGNHTSSVEEVEAVVDLIGDLTTPWVRWRDEHRDLRPVELDDILIVAPYNTQVTAIQERLPDARVGTVDKFQGQQAPIVIYSMASSSPDEAPRGTEFLYNLSRLNVATSRAKALSILIASPRLFERECRSPAQIRMANAFCRYLEMAANED